MKDKTMRKLPMLGMAAGAAALVSVAAARGGFKRDMEEIAASLQTGSDIAQTDSGPIEYARKGEGQPVLIIHGAGGGFDQGLFLGRELFGEEADLIAPSRFGYLRTPVPADGSPAAQADAHAALLDTLGIRKAVVVGVSAGAPSALEMALRHKDRLSALILLVPRLYAPSGPVGVEASAPSQAVLRLVMQGADFGFWVAMKLARRSLVRFLGVPPELEAKAARPQRERITNIIKSILPLSARLPGLQNDGAAKIGPSPLGEVEAPALIVTAEDDLFGTLPGARYTAERIAGAELIVLPDGGHLMLGRATEVGEALRAFLARLPAASFRAAA
jgi:pimeloyl-ACP methyl ester carboxylesterase